MTGMASGPWTPVGNFELPMGTLLMDEADPALWREVLTYALASEDSLIEGDVAEIGCCSHWLRPHQTRWTADGGFAWPSGYGSGQGGYSRTALPQFDWFFLLRWDGQRWQPCENRSDRPVLRLTIPSRTLRHQQAAVHAVWRRGWKRRTEFYGFRRGPEGWACTADSTLGPRPAPRKAGGTRRHDGAAGRAAKAW